MIIGSVVARLILLIAEKLDRNVMTVPDLDLYDGGERERFEVPVALGATG
jgi:hypothetical protein